MTSSVVYHRLPSGPMPKALTANAPVKTLLDHFLGFMARNKPKTFGDDVQGLQEAPMLVAFLVKIQQRRQIALKLCDTYAWALASRLKHYGFDLERCRELVALMTGYPSWEDLQLSTPTILKKSPYRWVNPFELGYAYEATSEELDRADELISEFVGIRAKERAEKREQRRRALDHLSRDVQTSLECLLSAQDSHAWRAWLVRTGEAQRRPKIAAKTITSLCKGLRTILGADKIRSSSAHQLMAVLFGYPHQTAFFNARDENQDVLVRTPESLKLPI